MVSKRSSKVSEKTHVQQQTQKKAYAWHSHDYREVLNLVGSTESGLDQSEVIERQKKFGKNTFSEAHTPNIFMRILTQLRSPLAFVLVLAFLVTLALEEYLDASVILFALAIAVVVGILQEGRASGAFKKLSDSQVRKAVVIREGKKHEINAEEVVPGDIVEIRGGGHVPADIRLIHTKKLAVNEASLTGEWLAVEKHEQSVSIGAPFAEQYSMAWMGTFVASGYGLGVVVRTANETVIGQVAASLASIEDEETPLQSEMHRISIIMLYIIAGFVVVIFGVGLIEGYSMHDMLLMSIAVAVASVPEGLPAAVTIILAVGMEALLKKGGLIRSLLAAETLGSTTYVLTDKTGTLTEAKMSLSGVAYHDVSNMSPDSWEEDAYIRTMLNVSLAATEAFVDEDEKHSEVRGNPVERAVLEAAHEIGLADAPDSYIKDRIDLLTFTSENRFAAGLSEIGDQFRLCINGAPEYLLQEAAYTYTEGGGATKITEEERNAYAALINEHTEAGRRLVGVAYKDVSYDDIPDNPKQIPGIIKKTVFMGILILDDPIRKGVKKAIAGVRGAGAEVILVSGDNPKTALSVARAVGIAGHSESALTGEDLEGLSDEELLDVLNMVHVFARVLPRQKLRIAQVLQNRGEIVAMTGDGVNDAPALKKANIGIAIGSGTEVAKESSDLVLVNDGFEIIYAAIEEGRRIIANLRKIVGYLLSTSLTEVVLIGTALVIGAPVPILPAQILWANVIEEGLMSVAFAFEGGEKNAMKRKPQDIHEEGILSSAMLWFILFVVTVLSMLTVSLYMYLLSRDTPLEELRSAMFLSISIDSLFMAFAFRSLTVPAWRIPIKENMFFVGSFLLSAFLLVLAITVPFLQQVLSYTPLPLNTIFLVLTFAFLALVTTEVSKWLFFERKSS